MADAAYQLAATFGAHPLLAIILAFVSAACEAIAVVGVVVPGTLILLALGVLVGTGHLSFWPVAAATAAGAVTGDLIGFWIGRRFGDRLRSLWPFSRRPELLERGSQFFYRHGGKSVLIARFVPGVKMVVPIVAGLVGMAGRYFIAASAVSSLLWTPALLLSGAATGYGVTAVGVVSRRLAALLFAILTAVGLFLFIRFLLRAAAPTVVRLYRGGVGWLMAHPGGLFARLGRAFDPDSPHVSAMVLFTLLLLAAILGLIALLQDSFVGATLVGLDEAVRGLAQSLRVAWGDAVMVFFTALGDLSVLAVVSAAALAYLLAVRAWPLAAALVVAAVAAELFVRFLGRLLHASLSSGALLTGHVTLVVVLVGIIASLALKGFAARWTALGLTAAFALGGTIALARVYLGVHWVSDAVAGLLFAGAVVAAFNLWLVGNPMRHIQPAAFGAVLSVVFIAFGAWHAAAAFEQNRLRYTLPVAVHVMAFDDWAAAGWQELPRRRLDFGGEHEEPLQLQWVGSPAVLAEMLTAEGWVPVRPWSVDAVLRLVDRDPPPLAELSALPFMHQGRVPALVLTKATENPRVRLVLRIWASDFEVVGAHGNAPLYLGSVVAQTTERTWAVVNLLREESGSPRAISEVRTALARAKAVLGIRAMPDAETVVLATAPTV